MEIRRLSPSDAATFRALRLEALRTAPEAFGASYTETLRRTEADFADGIATAAPGAIFGAFEGGAMVGMAGLMVPGTEKQRHKGVLWGVYVQPAFRGRAISRALVEAVIELARPSLAILQTSVVVGNDVARNTYVSCGFAVTGLEPKALLVNGVFLDEQHLALDFTQPGA